jgi:hypothetical protein
MKLHQLISLARRWEVRQEIQWFRRMNQIARHSGLAPYFPRREARRELVMKYGQ